VRLTKRISGEIEAEWQNTPSHNSAAATLPIYTLAIPGEVRAPAFGLLFRANISTSSSLEPAQVRAWQPGDRITLAHSGGPKKVKEVLARMHITGEQRAAWPVVAWRGKILWMQGATPAPAAPDSPSISAQPLDLSR
jgi:tRNA(Ile)-lysidine synthase